MQTMSKLQISGDKKKIRGKKISDTALFQYLSKYSTHIQNSNMMSMNDTKFKYQTDLD